LIKITYHKKNQHDTADSESRNLEIAFLTSLPVIQGEKKFELFGL